MQWCDRKWLGDYYGLGSWGRIFWGGNTAAKVSMTRSQPHDDHEGQTAQLATSSNKVRVQERERKWIWLHPVETGPRAAQNRDRGGQGQCHIVYKLKKLLSMCKRKPWMILNKGAHVRFTENSVKNRSAPTREANDDTNAVTTEDGSLDWKRGKDT